MSWLSLRLRECKVTKEHTHSGTVRKFIVTEVEGAYDRRHSIERQVSELVEGQV